MIEKQITNQKHAGQPFVSVTINCYNGEKYLREAIDSVYAQTYRNWEIIFWDNASTDRSAEIAKSYDERLRYFRGEKTVSLGKARNRALQKTEGGFIAFLDCDDFWLPEKLEKQIPLFRQNDEVAIVISNAIIFNDRGDTALYYKNKSLKTGHVFRELFANNFICLSSVVIRDSSLSNMNEWFDSRFNHIEETELFARIAYNWQLDYVDEPLVKNRIHKDSLSYLNPDLPAKELETMVEKFIKIFPDFEKLYKKEIANMRYYVQYYYAISEWRQGKNFLVRKRLRPFLAKKLRAMVPFLLSVFPYRYYEIVYRCFNDYIRKIPMA